MEIYNSNGYSAISKHEDEVIEIIHNGVSKPLHFPLRIILTTKISSFSVFLYRRYNSIENEIKIVNNEKRIRLGWIFPIQALGSNEHEFSNNEHFLNYAKAAAVLLGIEKFESIQPNSPNQIEDYYNADTHVLCICNENDQNYNNDEYFASFYKYGYFNYSDSQILRSVEYPEMPSIKVCKVSENIKSIEFIRKIFTEFLPIVESDILYYYYLYQIFELLMEQTLHIKLAKILAGMDITNASATTIKEALEEFQETLNEKKRITAIIDSQNSAQFGEYGEEFKRTSENFFIANKVNFKEKEHIAHRIYRIRNTLFHTLHKLNNLESLKEVNNSLVLLISCVIETLEIERM